MTAQSVVILLGRSCRRTALVTVKTSRLGGSELEAGLDGGGDLARGAVTVTGDHVRRIAPTRGQRRSGPARCPPTSWPRLSAASNRVLLWRPVGCHNTLR